MLCPRDKVEFVSQYTVMPAGDERAVKPESTGSSCIDLVKKFSYWTGGILYFWEIIWVLTSRAGPIRYRAAVDQPRRGAPSVRFRSQPRPA